MLLPLLNGIGSVIGSGEQLMSPIHLGDVARFVLFAVQDAKVRGVYNLVAGEPKAQREVVERLCYWLNVGSGPRVPGFAVRMALGEMSTLVLDSLGVCSRRMEESGFRLKYPDLDSMLSEVTQWTLHPFRPKEPVFVQYNEQFVPKPLEEIFPFFSDARNLEKITPDWLHFKIKKVTPEEIRKGTRIRYQLRLHGIPFGWLTDIAEWEPPFRFVDHQLKGPYALWYHEHTFHPVRGGTLLRDWVRFQLPFGKLGKWVGYPKVHSDVQGIFEHRKKKILEIMGT
jgi:ligand-binding SRPBCC domain-containing protein